MQVSINSYKKDAAIDDCSRIIAIDELGNFYFDNGNDLYSTYENCCSKVECVGILKYNLENVIGISADRIKYQVNSQFSNFLEDLKVVWQDFSEIENKLDRFSELANYELHFTISYGATEILSFKEYIRGKSISYSINYDDYNDISKNDIWKIIIQKCKRFIEDNIELKDDDYDEDDYDEDDYEDNHLFSISVNNNFNLWNLLYPYSNKLTKNDILCHLRKLFICEEDISKVEEFLNNIIATKVDTNKKEFDFLYMCRKESSNVSTRPTPFRETTISPEIKAIVASSVEEAKAKFNEFLKSNSPSSRGYFGSCPPWCMSVVQIAKYNLEYLSELEKSLAAKKNFYSKIIEKGELVTSDEFNELKEEYKKCKND